MLNEKKEFEEYSISEDRMNLKRLKKKPLKNMQGVRRALKIIARHRIFEAYRELELQDIVSSIKHDLGIWLSDPICIDEENDSISSDLYRWLERYVIKTILSENIQEIEEEIKSWSNADDKVFIQSKIKDIVSFSKSITEKKEICILEDDLCSNETVRVNFNRIEKWISGIIGVYKRRDKDLFRMIENNIAKNDMYDYCYEKLIVEAFEEGELKRYYLVSTKKKTVDNLKKKTGKGISNITRRSRTYDDEMDRILKFTAYVLLKLDKERTGEASCVFMSWVDFGNWTVQQTEKDNMDKYYYKGKPLYDICYLIHNKKDKKFPLVRLNEEWMDDHGWIIVEESEFCAEDYPDGVYYADFGAGEYLRCNEVYPKNITINC